MATSYPQFVLLGDSLFQNAVIHQDGFCFHNSLQTLCLRKLDVINRGLSGYNSRNLLQAIDGLFTEPTPGSPQIKYLAILIGANDAVLPWSPTKQHVPLEEYKENVSKIVNHPKIKAHNPKIFLVAPPPVDEFKHKHLDNQANGLSGSIRTSAVSASYAEKAREVARENPSVTLIDLWQIIMDKAISMTPNDYKPGGPWLGSPENGNPGGLDTLLPDGLHMSGEAYREFWEKGLLPQLSKEIQGPPDTSAFVLPTWQEVNGVKDW